jgi:ABC-2 type transport system ATP-binding protein
MQKRLDIACALIHKPEMLLLDEPTSELDLLRKKEVLKLIQSINKKGVTVIIATLPMEVEQICDRLMLVEDGTMVKQEDIEKKIKEIYPDNCSLSPDKFKPTK